MRDWLDVFSYELASASMPQLRLFTCQYNNLTNLSDDAADELVGHGHLVRLLVGGGLVARLVGRAQLRAGQGRQSCFACIKLTLDIM